MKGAAMAHAPRAMPGGTFRAGSKLLILATFCDIGVEHAGGPTSIMAKKP
jgi:hypothetical protein